jgi:hypothetical protein
MTRWLRLYDDLVDDPKVQRLPAETFKGLINLWCLASKSGGILPPHDEIAFKLRLSGPKTTKLLDDLVSAGLLDHDDTGLYPHNWNVRQYKSDDVTARTRKHRAKLKGNVPENVSGNVPEPLQGTPPETESDTDTESEKKETRASALRLFETWYSKYPHKVGRRAAENAFVAVVLKGATPDELLAGLAAYVRSKPPDRPWCNPATWLNQERWKDQPADTNGAAAEPVNVSLSIDEKKAKFREWRQRQLQHAGGSA